MDLTLTETQKVEREERRDEYVSKRMKLAEKAEKEAGHASPDVIYTAFQRNDVFTEDAAYDKSRASIENRQSLPVKQYQIDPDGALVKILGEASEEAVKLGIFCGRCEDRQPDSVVARVEEERRAKDMGISLPPGFNVAHNCCYCGALLGVARDTEQSSTFRGDDQLELLSLMEGQHGIGN